MSRKLLSMSRKLNVRECHGVSFVSVKGCRHPSLMSCQCQTSTSISLICHRQIIHCCRLDLTYTFALSLNLSSPLSNSSGCIIERVTTIHLDHGAAGDGSASQAEDEWNCCEEWDERDDRDSASSATDAIHDAPGLATFCQELDREHREHVEANQRWVPERISNELEQSYSDGSAERAAKVTVGDRAGEAAEDAEQQLDHEQQQSER